MAVGTTLLALIASAVTNGIRAKGLRGRNSPNCTWSQNGYGENIVPENGLATVMSHSE